MMRDCDQEAALEILSIVPHVMRTVAADLRRSDRAILPGHYHVLTLLADHSLSLSEIADRQHVSLPTMSRSISTLVERGWIEKIPDETDGRITRLELTGQGQVVLAEIRLMAVEAVTRQLAGLSARDCRDLVRGLAVLHRAFERPAPGPGEADRANARPVRSVAE
jgi:DNA-binding MarR family transcriptional regulator